MGCLYLIILFNLLYFAVVQHKFKKRSIVTQNIIEIKELKKHYSENTVLSDLNLNIPQNSILSVIGPNGCGKTTLFKLILGITDKNSGEISITPGARKGFMLDDCEPYEYLSLVQNLKAFSKISEIKINKNYIDYIISTSFCEKIKNKAYRSLSAGQKKKSLFAMSFINDPDMFILDEPLNSLDLKERIDMISSIKYLKEAKNKTILISSHDLASLYELCDIFCFLKNGKICRTVEKKDIDADSLHRIYLEIF